MKKIILKHTIIIVTVVLFANFSYSANLNNNIYLGSENEINKVESNTLLAMDSNLDKYSAYYTEIAERDKQSYLFVSTSTLIGLMAIGVGVLYVLPSNFTNWEKQGLGNDLAHAGSNWVDNVTEGPVWDRDNLFLNFVTHPYWGAVYYMQARNAGYDEFQSFLFSSFASTFMWEYGVEAFAETPSIQDLIITPVLGSLLGEGFYRLSNKIKKNNYKVYDSKALGYTLITIMDPLYLLINKTRLHKYTTKDTNQMQQTSYSSWGASSNSIMLRMSIPIN